METQTLTTTQRHWIQILGPILSFGNASEAADQNRPARQDLSATLRATRRGLGPIVNYSGGEAKGLQILLDAWAQQYHHQLKQIFEKKERDQQKLQRISIAYYFPIVPPDRSISVAFSTSRGYNRTRSRSYTPQEGGAMSLYSLKMRASREEKHISGAERIVPCGQILPCANLLVQRGLSHSKGSPDQLHLKVTKVDESCLLFLEALPVHTLEVGHEQEGWNEIRKFLGSLKVTRVDEIIGLFAGTYAMRGAMLLDVDTLERLEPDPERGVRATCMDAQRASLSTESGKNHFEEALVLATKVAHAPNIVGELCVSDDPEHVTGYVASRETGYCRITKLKPKGSENGGRIFLYRGRREDVPRTIAFLQEQPVIVRGLPPHPADRSCQDKLAYLEEKMQQLKARHLERSLATVQSAPSTTVQCQGKKVLLLASNNYLGLSCEEEIKTAAVQALRTYGTGSGGSRLTTGNTVLHERLEKKLADFKGAESALVFNTGYVANLAIISSLLGKNDVIFSDELNHASIIDGCRLSGARIVVYKHKDLDDLEQKLKEYPCSRGMVVSDAVFSMDGDLLDLPRFVKLADQYNLLSMVDEAHSTGVLGETGRGIVEHYDHSCSPDILMGTLSKAIGSEGGFVCGCRKLVEVLMNQARGFMFSTSLPPATVAASLKALEFIEEHPERVKALRDNVRFFCQCLRQRGVEIHSDSAIVPLLVGDEQKTVEASEALFDAGFFIPAVRYPSVGKGQARLRVTLMAIHTQAQLEGAADAISRVLREKGVIF